MIFRFSVFTSGLVINDSQYLLLAQSGHRAPVNMLLYHYIHDY